jgi:hypothetical protein
MKRQERNRFTAPSLPLASPRALFTLAPPPPAPSPTHPHSHSFLQIELVLGPDDDKPLPARSHYDVLNSHRASFPAELKSSYRRMALLLHPDKNPQVRHTACTPISTHKPSHSPTPILHLPTSIRAPALNPRAKVELPTTGASATHRRVTSLTFPLTFSPNHSRSHAIPYDDVPMPPPFPSSHLQPSPFRLCPGARRCGFQARD